MTTQTFAQMADTVTNEILSSNESLIVALSFNLTKPEFNSMWNNSTKIQRQTFVDHAQNLADHAHTVFLAAAQGSSTYDKTLFETPAVVEALETLKANKRQAIKIQTYFGAKTVGNFKTVFKAIDKIDELMNTN